MLVASSAAVSLAGPDTDRYSRSHVQLVNPSETFGDIVIDYSYVELTSACITALTGRPSCKELA